MTQKDLVLSSHPDYHHCVGEVSGHHEPKTARCHVLGAEVAIHTGHGDDAETGSVSGVEAERQNAPALDEAGATAGVNTQGNAGDDDAPDLVIVTSTGIVTAIALVHTPPDDDAAVMPSYTSRAPPSLDGAAQAAAASFPFSSLHPLHVLVSSDPLPSSSNDPAPVSPLPIADVALASSSVPPAVFCPAPHAQ